jgi:hypothetical protein
VPHDDLRFTCDTADEALAVQRLLAGPNPVDPAPRLAILAAMPPHVGDDTLTVPASLIAQKVGKHVATIDQMLGALRADGVVDCAQHAGRRVWWRTAAPLPERFTSTAAPTATTRHDDTALREALGIPLQPPRLHARARLVKLR